MKNFKLYNNIVGWVTFVIAAITYLLTIEPTASLWDCGEFISSAYKLEVGHPPGNPIFMMTGRLFSLFASDPTQVAAMVNTMSALCSAFAILFLFWTITHIARRIVQKEGEELTAGQTIAILGAGLVGALAYTFSDTFWFSAVEGEVYAYSSFLTALLFWCILKWEDCADSPYAGRWIVLIAYLMGLSIGVHLLNLLTIPAIVLLYYFKKYDVTVKNTILAVVASVVILAFVFYGMIPGFVKVASRFELFFVNTLGMGYNSGFLAYIITTAAVLVWAAYETQKGRSDVRMKIAFLLSVVIVGAPFFGDGIWIGIIITAAIAAVLFLRKEGVNRYWLNTIVMCMMVILIGYSSFTLIVVRSLANTPMDQNSPENVFSLQSYLNRDQYGEVPLFYGALYSAPEKAYSDGRYCKPVRKYGPKEWVKDVTLPEGEARYVSPGRKFEGYEKDDNFKMLFPRMYSSKDVHIEEYKRWADIKGHNVRYNQCGHTDSRVAPTFGENLKFFFSYQVNHMYWRYFMWNFSGRQNDLQGFGEVDKGNWITGIPFIDNAMYGDQSKLPPSYKDNHAHNRYFMLPLLLGILGICWQLMQKGRGVQNFWIVFAFFFMTGLAIVVYLNQKPLEPRERDYAYAGSFYAFAIWIGLGVMFLYDLCKRYIPKRVAAVAVSVICLGVPVLMAQQNWDDHDRSHRSVARDVGHNYLNSCAENAIYFCNGDNDTFPVWYCQEVEGDRTDIRACNLSYLTADWYVDQMKRGAYESAPLPISWTPVEYQTIEAAIVEDDPRLGGKMDLGLALDLMRQEQVIKSTGMDGVSRIYARTLTLPIDKEQVIRTGTVAPEDSALIVDTMEIRLPNMLYRSHIMFLEMLRTNNWVRPIYCATTIGNTLSFINGYERLEGTSLRVVPIKSGRQNVNTDVMYDNLMNRFRWGRTDSVFTYLDEPNRASLGNLRSVAYTLAFSLANEGKNDKAKEVLDRVVREIPAEIIPYEDYALYFAQVYYTIGDNAKAEEFIGMMRDEFVPRLEWYASLPADKRNCSYEMSPDYVLQKLSQTWQLANMHKSPMAAQLRNEIEKYAGVMR